LETPSTDASTYDAAVSDHLWIPDAETIDLAQSTALARHLGVETYEDVLELALAEPDAVRLAGGVGEHDAVDGRVLWMDEPVTLQLEHKNGVNNDNRLENLELLCPLCHSQTSTYGGKNSKWARAKRRWLGDV
jgi:hypothetical protein